MKKILCLFGALSLLLTSCSSDDSNSSDLVLVKKVVLTSADGKSKSTSTFKYDGNKIVSITDETGSMVYTYTGDVITKLEFKDSDGVVEQVNTYTYGADGKLATFLRVEEDNDILRGHKEVYIYNVDGTISVKLYGGDEKTQTTPSGTSTIKFVNGDVSEITSTNSSDHKYAYDGKNNPAKNILGYDKIAFVDGESSGGIFQNEVSDTADGKVVSTYSYTYNAAGYPEKGNENTEGLKYTSEYFY